MATSTTPRPSGGTLVGHTRRKRIATIQLDGEYRLGVLCLVSTDSFMALFERFLAIPEAEKDGFYAKDPAPYFIQHGLLGISWASHAMISEYLAPGREAFIAITDSREVFTRQGCLGTVWGFGGFVMEWDCTVPNDIIIAMQRSDIFDPRAVVNLAENPRQVATGLKQCVDHYVNFLASLPDRLWLKSPRTWKTVYPE